MTMGPGAPLLWREYEFAIFAPLEEAAARLA